MSETAMAQENMDLETLFPAWTPSFLKRLYSLYPRSDFNSTFYQRQTVFGDFIISCPTYYMSTAVSDYKPTYKMIFNAGTQMHGATQPFLLRFQYGSTCPIVAQTIFSLGHLTYLSACAANTSADMTGDNSTIGNIMKDYYVSFVTHLDPNAFSYSGTPKPAWPSYQSADGGNFEVMYVNYTMMAATQDFDAGPRCDFWHSESYIARN